MNGDSRPILAAPIAHSRESTLLKTRTTQNVPWKSKSFVCINIWGFSLLRGSLIILCLFLFKLLLLYYYRTKKKKKKSHKSLDLQQYANNAQNLHFSFFSCGPR